MQEAGSQGRRRRRTRARTSTTRTTLGPRAGPTPPSRTLVRTENFKRSTMWVGLK